LGGYSVTIHAQSYRSHAICTEFGKEKLEFTDEIIEFDLEEEEEEEELIEYLNSYKNRE
jgi:PDZ domain-containing secreted protein